MKSYFKLCFILTFDIIICDLCLYDNKLDEYVDNLSSLWLFWTYALIHLKSYTSPRYGKTPQILISLFKILLKIINFVYFLYTHSCRSKRWNFIYMLSCIPYLCPYYITRSMEFFTCLLARYQIIVSNFCSLLCIFFILLHKITYLKLFYSLHLHVFIAVLVLYYVHFSFFCTQAIIFIASSCFHSFILSFHYFHCVILWLHIVVGIKSPIV